MTQEDSPLDKFLAQAPAAVGEDNESSVVPNTAFHHGFKQRLITFFFEKSSSGYSSIAPRRPDGSRTKLFFFNGGGRGR